MNKQALATTINVGLSACLAGQEVRFNGGHTRSKLCMEQLQNYFNFKTYCPELAAGLGVPRPAMRLQGDPESPRLICSDNPQTDLTDQFIKGVSPALPGFSELDGYILMKNSPSCGMERVKVYNHNGQPQMQRTEGLFTGMLRAHYPQLPIEEEGRLNDDHLRENFILRVYAHHNFRQEVMSEPSYRKLQEFHGSYKYVLMAHNQVLARDLGRLLAESHQQPIEVLMPQYFELFMAVLAKPASRKGHSNALLHILGYLKKTVNGWARQNIVDAVESYRRGNIPLITPLTLLNHYIPVAGNEYIQAQRYLEPYPEALGLRNSV